MNFEIDRYFTTYGYGFDNDFLENLKNQSNIKELKNNSKEFFDYHSSQFRIIHHFISF